ncbi:MAG TPA: BamA/TamA family outer membrane protein [Gemmatimonadaceae bacterium]|nr:BamA/TamA family outer membrane protein [Gemmatimonadaceae bacterium]
MPAAAGARGRRRGGAAWGPALLWLLMLLLVPGVARAQETACDPGDVEVRGLAFTGNTTFPDAELARRVVVTPSGWLRRTLGVVGTRRCVAREELRLDVARLILYYRRRGFPEVAVDTTVRAVGEDAIAVRFAIREGPPLRIDTLTVTGLDSVAARGRLLATLGLHEGDRLDQYALDSARNALVRRLRDDGYPYADAFSGFRTHVPTRSAAVELDVVPGPLAHLGEIEVAVTPREGSTQQVPDGVVHRLLGLKPGQRYRERDLVAAQRRLYETDAFAHVEIALDSARQAAVDSTVDVHVALRETYMHSARAGVGYGTLDCFRLSGEYTDVNFLHQARRLELNARMSKIGVGAPLNGAESLCFPEVRDDIYSDSLNYYVGATLRTPVLFGLTFPTMTLYSERRSEFKAFLRTTPVALGLTRSWPRGLGVPLTGSYTLEYGRTQAQPALFCAAFNLCTDEDRRGVTEFRRLAVLGLSAERARTDDPVEPTRGSIVRLDLRHASRAIGSDPLQEFNQVTGNVSGYVPLSDGVVLAGRLRMGAVLGSRFEAGGARFVPPQERLYAGGPSTVRGFRQNELGPVAYLANQYDTVTVTLPSGETRRVFRASADSGYARVVPLGGNSVIVANLELRARSPLWPELVEFTLFADAGKVSSGIDLTPHGLKWTPGVGVRVSSPVGPLRVDVGYNPYALAAGAAYFDAPLDAAVAPLYCVSPTNGFPVTDQLVDGRLVAVQESSGRACPATFRPTRGSGLLRRLALHFSIGQAF